jgi:Permeases of the drug/metabolite transporter (DMT) superfamily
MKTKRDFFHRAGRGFAIPRSLDIPRPPFVDTMLLVNMNMNAGLSARHLSILVLGTLVASTSVLMIKASSLHPILQASYRLLWAVVALLPFYFLELKNRGERPSMAVVKRSILPGLILGLHFIAWIYGARLTLAGNSTVIVNMTPVIMPFVAYLVLGLLPDRKQAIGTLVASAGLVVLALSDYSASSERLLGDLVCLAAMVLYALYLALSRRNNPEGRLWSYLVPLYAAGGLFCLAIGLVLGLDPIKMTWMDAAMTAGLALGPTIVGHSISNWGMSRFAPQVVSIINLLQFIFAGIFAFILFGEIPDASFYVTSILIVAGAVIAILPGRLGSPARRRE